MTKLPVPGHTMSSFQLHFDEAIMYTNFSISDIPTCHCGIAQEACPSLISGMSVCPHTTSAIPKFIAQVPPRRLGRDNR